MKPDRTVLLVWQRYDKSKTGFDAPFGDALERPRVREAPDGA